MDPARRDQARGRRVERGVTRVAEPARLSRSPAAALTLDDRVLAEDVISGREIDLAV
jgi:hypothetical protein